MALTFVLLLLSGRVHCDEISDTFLAFSGFDVATDSALAVLTDAAAEFMRNLCSKMLRSSRDNALASLHGYASDLMSYMANLHIPSLCVMFLFSGMLKVTVGKEVVAVSLT